LIARRRSSNASRTSGAAEKPSRAGSRTGSPSTTGGWRRLARNLLGLPCCPHPASRPSANARWGIFSSGRGGGKRITFTPEELADGLEIVDGLRGIARSGAFSATPQQKDCRYCDFESICRDTEKIAEQSEKKLENEENEILKTFRKLRNK
jgi:hypothetical protein